MTKKIYLIISFIILLIFTAQAQVDKNKLESHFRSGNAPGQSEFYDLINSCYNYSVEKGLIYDPKHNSLRAEVTLDLLKQMLADTSRVNRERIAVLIQNLEQLNNDGETDLLNKIQTNSENLKFDIENLNLGILDSLYNHRQDYNSRSSKLELALKDTANNIRTEVDNKFNLLEIKNGIIHQDMALKLRALEIGLKDSTELIRTSMKLIEEGLRNESISADKDIKKLLNNTKAFLILKIDSLADAQNADKVYQDLRMTSIENKHSVLKDTVVKMKVKLDTLNYTEQNFTQTLKLKLNNIEEGATRSDNNFADSLVTKLVAIEKNANNYQLPMSNHAKLGGIKLSGDFVLYDGKVYSALDPEKIDRWYATDTIINDWSNVMLADQKWTKVRMKIPTGNVDVGGNKIYNYGEFNPAYKFIYDDLETSYYEYNGTDESNVILGEHEKQKKIMGVKNTLIGHKAGYNLFEGGDENVIVGFQAGQSSANVSHNVFIGSKAGQNIQGGSGDIGEMNVAIGSHSMSGRNNNIESLALGFASMELGEQKGSVAIGTKAMGKNSGDNNIAIGYEAAFSAEGSNNKQNINLGYRAAYASMTAQRNIGIGDSTAFSNISGKGNLFIGHGSGKTNTLSGNLFIGHGIDEGGSDKMLIGNNGKVLISGDFTSGLVKINKLSSSQIKIGEDKEVINASAQFVGIGGVNTPTVNASTTLSAAGIDIIKKVGSVITERYAQKSHSHNNADIATDATHRFVTDTEKSVWNNKVDKVSGKALSSNDFTLVLKNKLDRIAEGANNYTHPSSHAASMITTDANRQFVSATEKKKLAGIQVGATNYTHPNKHAASMITTDANNRFVSDAEKIRWNKEYIHPNKHEASMITTDANRQFVSATEKKEWSAGNIPIGGIIMWSGTNIPDGWALCDGSKKKKKTTPDLRGRFIVGNYPGKPAYNIGKKGGTVSMPIKTSEDGEHIHNVSIGAYKLKESDIPYHKHTFKNYFFAEVNAHSVIRTNSAYGYEYIEKGIGSGDSDHDNNRVFYKKMDTEAYGKLSYSQNSHSHTATISKSPVHDHKVDIPYYALAFIMRVK